jgi:ketosteroid isomerase-like protein
MNITRFVRVVILCLAGLGCVCPLKAVDLDALKKSLLAADDAWAAAAVARNVDKVANGYYADDGIAYPPEAPVAVGLKATAKIWTDGFADASYKISWKATRVDLSDDGTMGVTAGTYVESYKGNDGKMVTNHGKYVCVWKQNKAGEWKAVHDIWNSDGP